MADPACCAGTDPDSRLGCLRRGRPARSGPLLPAHRIGQANLRAAFPDKDAAWIEATLRDAWENLGRVAGEYVHLGADLGFRPRPPERRAASRPTTWPLFVELRDDGKPALCFAAHLANWELPAVAAAAHGLPSAVRLPDAEQQGRGEGDRPHPRAADGAPDPHPRAGGAGDGGGAEAGEHLGMVVDQHFSRGVDVTFFGRRCKANPTIARLARQFDCPVVGVRVIRLPGRGFRIDGVGPVRTAARRRTARSMCRPRRR